jgi:GNAT superfamily N-acetyltransferase
VKISDASTTGLRVAAVADAPAMAALHADRISEGFLPTLGQRFLARLYRRIVRSHRASAFVLDEHGVVVAFAAGTTDVGAFYREFLIRDGIPSMLLAAPHARQAWRRVLETLKYPSATGDLPAAEVLAVATDLGHGGRGYGATTVHALTAELAGRGCDAVKVTVGGGNEVAMRMYRACGFLPAGQINVHGERRSEVLTWARS